MRTRLDPIAWIRRRRAVAAGIVAALTIGTVTTVAITSDDGAGSESAAAPAGQELAAELPLDGQVLDLSRPLSDDSRSGTFLGALDDAPGVFVSIATDEGTIRAYVCDGEQFGHWFSGQVMGSSFDLTNAAGSRLTGMVAEGRAVGSYTAADGTVQSFTASQPLGDGGLFRAEGQVAGDAAGEAAGSTFVAGWIVHDDGELRGVSTVTDPSGQPVTEPAPAIDATEVRAEPTVELAVAGPTPVTEVTAESLSGPVPSDASAPLETPATDGATVVDVQPADSVPPVEVGDPPTLTASFSPAKVPAGATSTWVGVLTNPGKVALAGIDLDLAFPDPVVPVPGGSVTDCAGFVAQLDPAKRIPGDPQVVAGDVALDPGASCTVKVDVTVGAGAFKVVSGAPVATNASAPGPVAVAVVEGTGSAPAASTTTTVPPTAATTTTVKPAVTTTTVKPAVTTTTVKPAVTTTTVKPAVTTTTVKPAATTTTVAGTKPAATSTPKEGPAVTVSVTAQLGVSPLSVTITPAVPADAKPADWSVTFSDATLQAKGTGALVPIPKTFVNDGTDPVVVHADVLVTFADGTVSRARVSFTVVPKGGAARAIVVEPTGPAQRGAAYQLPVRVINGEAKPLTLAKLTFAVAGASSFAGTGWSCAKDGVCSLATAIPPGGSSPVLTIGFEKIPLDTPASLTLAWSGELEGKALVPVEGFQANAGPDQTVDAVQVLDAAGATGPAKVILDGSGSTSSLGAAPRTFTWRQTSGPTVTLQTSADPSGQRVVFDAPAVTSASVALGFELTVTDGTTTDTDSVQVTVLRTNRPPTITVAAKGLTPNASGNVVPAAGATVVELLATTSDPDGDAVTVTWRVPGVPAAVISSSGKLTWPIPNVPFAIVEGVAADGLGRSAVASIAVGTPPAPLTLSVKADKTTTTGGSTVKLTASPSRSAGVTVRWTQVSGDAVTFSAATGALTTATMPSTVAGPRTVVLRATATPNDGTAAVSSDITIVATEAAPLSVVVTPAQNVSTGATVNLTAAVGGPSGATVQWTVIAGPAVTITNANKAAASFTAPATAPAVIVVRATVTSGTNVVTADQVVTVGTPPTPVTGSGCVSGSVLGRVFAGERVLLIGAASTVMLGDVAGAIGECTATTLIHNGTDINLFNVLTGDGLSGTIDATKICFTSGTVRINSKFDLAPIQIGSLPLCLVYGSVGGGPGASVARPAAFDHPERTAVCDFPLEGELRFPADIPFVKLPAGITPGDTVLSVDCDALRLTSSASFDGGGTLNFDGTIGLLGGSTTTITASGLQLFGGTVGGSITATVSGGALAFAGSLDIQNPQLPFGDGVTLNRLALSFKDGKVGFEGRLTLGTSAPQVQLDLSGEYRGITGFVLTAKAATTSAWTPVAGLTVGAASIVGTVEKTAFGKINVNVTAAATGNWTVVPGVAVRSITLQVGNTAPPAECTGIPADSVFVRVGGVTDVTIPGRSPLTTQIDACLGLPGTKASGSNQPAFLLRSLSTMPPLRPNPALDISIERLELRVAYLDGELEASIRGDARVLGLGLTAKLLFKTAPGGDVLVIVASGDLTPLGTPISTGSVIFATGDVDDVEIGDGLVIDVLSGLSLVSTIDLGEAQRQLLNDVLKPPTPIAGTLIISATLGGPDMIFTAALDFGPNGIELFKTCPTATCQSTAVNTTLFRLDSGFITLRVGASGFQLGIGGEGTLLLPPAKGGTTRSELQLGLEAFFRPPAELGLSFHLLSEDGWQDAVGITGLTVNALVVQGSIDFTVPTAPVPSIGLLAEVSNLPTDLADLIGFQNNGEPIRLALNIAPKNPIIEITIGEENDQAVLKPLAKIDGAATGLDDALTVDHASLVFAPLGGAIGPITYSPGISVRFGATLLGTVVEVNATVDLAALRIIANMHVGSFEVGGIQIDDTQLLLDLQPLGFRFNVQGGVNIPDGPQLTGAIDVQAGVLAAIAQTGALPAPSTSLPRPAAGISFVADLGATSWAIAPGVTITNLKLHGEGALDAVSAEIEAVFGVDATAQILGGARTLKGSARLKGTSIEELHVQVGPGTLNIGGVQITGDGTCQASLVSAPAGGGVPISTSFGSVPARGSTGTITGLAGATAKTAAPAPAAPVPSVGTGPCLQLDYVKGATPPAMLGMKGKLKAGSVTVDVVGSLDERKANLQAKATLGELGTLTMSGVLYHGANASLTTFRIKIKEETTAVTPETGSWRFDGEFTEGEALKGIEAPWEFSIGSVDAVGRTRVTWARILGDVTATGFTASVKGDITFSGSTMQYTLIGDSTGKIDRATFTINPNPDALSSPAAAAANTLHGVIRPVVFALDSSPASHQVGIEQVRGKLIGSADYRLHVEIRHNAAPVFQFIGTAEVLYAEGFKRGSATSFTDEAENKWNNPIDIGLDIDSSTGKACFRWGDPGDFDTIEWGAC